MFDRFKSTIKDLIYPKNCFSCGHASPIGEAVFCSTCQFKIKPTDINSSLIKDKFVGQIKLNNAINAFVFTKDGLLQNLIHQLKYNSKPTIGIGLGRLFAKQFKETGFFKEIDLIIPVPIHDKKRKIRGYNQAYMFAKGIGDYLKIPYSDEIITRNIHTESQTKKSREERFENVKGVFHIPQSSNISKKHILIVDDVITTGATIKSMIKELNTIEDIKISIATIAMADK